MNYAIASQKGGVGKTTTAVSLAHGLSRRGKRVLIVDTDTQNHVVECLGIDTEASLYDVVIDEMNVNDAIVEARPNLFVLAGGQNVAKLRRFIQLAEVEAEYVLTDALSSAAEQFDIVIIDSSPAWDLLAVNVLFFAKRVIVPVELDVLAVNGLFKYTKQIGRLSKRSTVAQLHTILPTMVNASFARTDELLTQLTDYFGSELIAPPIRTSSRLAECPAHKQTIYEYAAADRAVSDYEKLVDRILQDFE